MALNFFSGSLALGTGSSSFVELVASGYARTPIVFGSLVSGQTSSIALTSFTSANYNTWPTATQYGLFDGNGHNLIWWQNPAISPAGISILAANGFTLSFPDLVTSVTPNASIIFAPGTTITSVGVQIGAFAGNPGVVKTPGFAGTSIQVAAGQLGKL